MLDHITINLINIYYLIDISSRYITYNIIEKLGGSHCAMLTLKKDK